MIPTCQVCGTESETLHHLLFLFPHAWANWLFSPLQICTPHLPLDLKEVILQLLNNLNEEQKRLDVYLAWNIWKIRNSLNL
jgi:hypothetical protein